MGFSKPAKPDTSAADRQIDILEEQRDDARDEADKKDRENKARRRALRGGRAGFRSLLYGSEQGVTEAAGQTLG